MLREECPLSGGATGKHQPSCQTYPPAPPPPLLIQELQGNSSGAARPILQPHPFQSFSPWGPTRTWFKPGFEWISWFDPGFWPDLDLTSVSSDLNRDRIPEAPKMETKILSRDFPSRIIKLFGIRFQLRMPPSMYISIENERLIYHLSGMLRTPMCRNFWSKMHSKFQTCIEVFNWKLRFQTITPKIDHLAAGKWTFHSFNREWSVPPLGPLSRPGLNTWSASISLVL